MTNLILNYTFFFLGFLAVVGMCYGIWTLYKGKKHWGGFWFLFFWSSMLLRTFEKMNAEFISDWITLVAILSIVVYPLLLDKYHLTKKIHCFLLVTTLAFLIPIVSGFMGVWMGNNRISPDAEIEGQANMEYLANTVDLESGEFDETVPAQNEFQSMTKDMFQKIFELNANTERKIESLGKYEFENAYELKEINEAKSLKNNLENFWNIKESHYKKINEIGAVMRKKYNISSTNKKNSNYYFEKLENAYVQNLLEFYDFVIEHHDEMEFQEDGTVLMESDATVKKFNDLLEKVWASAEDLNLGVETRVDTIKESLNEVREGK